MEGKAKGFQHQTMRGRMDRIVRSHGFIVRGRELDKRRCQNPAVFSRIGLRFAWLSLHWRVYGMRLRCAFEFLALA
jgi:hypothetical protein